MSLVVFGSGPGIGRNIGALFAEKGFQKVILLSRDSTRLQDDANFVKSKNSSTNVEVITIDLADIDKVRTTLREVDSHLKDAPLQAVLFNAARVGMSELWKFTAEELEGDLRISVISLYVIAQWALPQLESNLGKAPQAPTFLVTSGGLYKDPFPSMFSLSTSKAAQYNLVHSLYKEYSPKGVHCALLVVRGRVSDDAKVTTARNIAEEAWKLYEQPKGNFDKDVEIDDPDYLAFMKKREAGEKM